MFALSLSSLTCLPSSLNCLTNLTVLFSLDLPSAPLLVWQEYLVGASPEMFVRCERTGDGIRVETCPISGTIERGANPLEDAQRIRTLLTNKKEESELTMCTDVDRY